MSLIESIIVYFSIGASFGAHRMFNSSGSKHSRLISAIVAFLLWPFIYVSKFFNYFISVRSKLVFDAERKTDSSFDTNAAKKQNEIDCLLRRSFSGVSLYSYKDVLARYTGLSVTISDSSGLFKYENLFFDERNSSDLQSTCLSRRNRAKLLRHRTAVRYEFMELVSRLIELSDDPKSVTETAVGFAAAINDLEAVDFINANCGNLRQNQMHAPVQQLEKQSWAPQEQ